MMNFHPEVGGAELITESLLALRALRPDLVPQGFLVSSGRYYHYYGNGLIEQEKLSDFLSFFLMPSILVSPRYIGHSLYEGQCSLRLTHDADYKPQLPVVTSKVS